MMRAGQRFVHLETVKRRFAASEPARPAKYDSPFPRTTAKRVVSETPQPAPEVAPAIMRAAPPVQRQPGWISSRLTLRTASMASAGSGLAMLMLGPFVIPETITVMLAGAAISAGIIFGELSRGLFRSRF